MTNAQGQTIQLVRGRPAEIWALLMVLVSCFAIGIAPVLAKLALNGGSNALTIVTVRNLVMAFILAVVMACLRKPFRLPRKALIRSVAMGPVYILLGMGYLGAVAYIPVNLTILIYFLHPLLIGIIVRLIGHEAVSLPRIAAFALALAGLGIAIGVRWTQLNPMGLGLALLSAVACTVMIVSNSVTMKSADSLAVTFWMVLSAAIILAVANLAFGRMVWPHDLSGWVGFAGVGLAYTIGLTLFFVAVPILGATRATMLTNLEPLVGIGFAMLLLNEQISLLQALGMALVFLSIAVTELAHP